MAKYEKTIKGNFDKILKKIETQVISGNIIARLKDKSDFIINNTKCSVRVYERSSWAGSHKVSLNITLIQSNNSDIHVSAITSGGSSLVFFKRNAYNEKLFLNKIKKILE